MTAPLTYVVQTTINPGVDYQVSAAEYEQLLELGLILNGPANPAPPNIFDTDVAALINDPNSLAFGALRAKFGQAQTVAPVNPTVGQVWISY